MSAEKFIVHHSGPDDVFEAESWRAAVLLAHQINISVVEYTTRTESPGLIRSWATPYTLTDAIARGVISEAQQ